MRFSSAAFVVLFGCSGPASKDAPRDEAVPVRPSGEAEAEPMGPIAAGDRKAVREAYRAAMGRDLGEEVDCVQWPEAFAHVVLVGTFAHDRGCMLEGFFIDRTWYDGRRSDAVADGLATVGWADAAIDEREVLARAWIDSVTHAFDGQFVREEQTAFVFEDTPAFEPVQVKALEDGGVLVSGWVSLPSGMVWESAYHFMEYRFDRQGALSRTSSRGFSVEGERIRDHEDAAMRELARSAVFPPNAPPDASPTASTRPAPVRTPSKPTVRPPAPSSPPPSKPTHRAPH